MMTDEQMEKEANRRIENMSPEERKKLESEISEGLDLEDKLWSRGITSLDRMEHVKYAKFRNQDIDAQNNTGFENYQDIQLEFELMNNMHLSKKEIQQMKKNPFMSGFYKSLIIAALPTLCIVAAKLLEKHIGTDITNPVIVGLGSLSGLLALYSARALVKALHFWHVKKSYNSKYEERLINNKVFLKIKEEVKRNRGI